MLHTFNLTNCQSLSFFFTIVSIFPTKKDCVGSPDVRLAVFLTIWDFHADVIIFERHPILTKGSSVELAQHHICVLCVTLSK